MWTELPRGTRVQHKMWVISFVPSKISKILSVEPNLHTFAGQTVDWCPHRQNCSKKQAKKTRDNEHERGVCALQHVSMWRMCLFSHDFRDKLGTC
mmetsp:Transcript_7321/g.15653  ORF Transcript_7321/g.15653 Transcript_7321/m.15653 type:complete len:95 (-) Transcript_7321:11-295(-)